MPCPQLTIRFIDSVQLTILAERGREGGGAPPPGETKGGRGVGSRGVDREWDLGGSIGMGSGGEIWMGTWGGGHRVGD